MRRPVGVRFDVQDLALWDERARERGMSRTALFELAMGELVGRVSRPRERTQLSDLPLEAWMVDLRSDD